MEDITLRGLVFSKFHTLKDFSEDIGWKRNKAWRIVNDKQRPDDIEMAELAECLHMTKSTFLKLFFPSLFTMCTNDSREAS